MPKKFHDIIPPQAAEKEEILSQKENKKSLLPKILIGVVFLILLLGSVLYFKLPEAEIEIFPKTNFLSFEEEVIVDERIEEVDILKKAISGKVLEEEKELWKEFPATGVVENAGKAKGIIRVYNKYSPPTPISLVPQTKFLSESGEYFVSPKSIYIPAATRKGGELVPSWTEIEVVALKSGEDYNIGPSEFSIPGLAGTSYYHTVTGESTQSMKGGFEKEQSQVIEEDLKKAGEDLTQQLLTDVDVSLRNKISSDFILLEDAISKQITEISPMVKPEDLVEQFSVQGKAKGKVLIFKKEELESFVKEYIFSKIPTSKKIYEESLEIEYTPELINLRENRISLNLKFSTKVYPNIKSKDLVELIKGKSQQEIEESIYNKFSEEISEIKVNFWPFWVRKAPGGKDRINVKFKIK